MPRKRFRLPDFALKLALSKTSRFLTKVEFLGVGVFSPQSNIHGVEPKEQRRRRAEKRLSKRASLESPFLLCPLRVFRTSQVFLRTNLKGAEKKRTLQKHPFGETISPHDAFAAPLALLFTIF